jgi:dipeptidyl-peptidase-3
MHTICFVAIVIHELLGHGTGKLLSATTPGHFNFNAQDPPTNPHTGKNVTSWYRPGEKYSIVFEDIAQSVEECCVVLMSTYLIDNKEFLSIFGYDETTKLSADELVYLSYLHLGVEGIRSLEHYNAEERSWSQAYSRGYFGIFKHLLQEGNGVLSVHLDAQTSELAVSADRSKIVSCGKPALGRMMCCLHVWRCTADVKACREFYEALTGVEGEREEWRKVVVKTPEPRWKFVHANTKSATPPSSHVTGLHASLRPRLYDPLVALPILPDLNPSINEERSSKLILWKYAQIARLLPFKVRALGSS